MSIDYTNYIGQIRALINDTNEEALEFDDDQLEAYYQMSYCNVIQSAIMALRGLIAKYSLTGGDKYRLDTIEYEEGKSKASNFQSLLNNLEQSIKDGTNPMLCSIPRTFGIYTKDRHENYSRMLDGEIIPPKTADLEYELLKRNEQDGPYYEG